MSQPRVVEKQTVSAEPQTLEPQEELKKNEERNKMLRAQVEAVKSQLAKVDEGLASMKSQLAKVDEELLASIESREAKVEMSHAKFESMRNENLDKQLIDAALKKDYTYLDNAIVDGFIKINAIINDVSLLNILCDQLIKSTDSASNQRIISIIFNSLVISRKENSTQILDVNHVPKQDPQRIYPSPIQQLLSSSVKHPEASSINNLIEIVFRNEKIFHPKLNVQARKEENLLWQLFNRIIISYSVPQECFKLLLILQHIFVNYAEDKIQWGGELASLCALKIAEIASRCKSSLSLSLHGDKAWEILGAMMQRFDIDFGVYGARTSSHSKDEICTEVLGEIILKSGRQELINLMRQKDRRHLFLGAKAKDFTSEEWRVWHALENGDIETVAKCVTQGTKINSVIPNGPHKGSSLFHGLVSSIVSPLHAMPNSSPRDLTQPVFSVMQEMINGYPRENYLEPLYVNYIFQSPQKKMPLLDYLSRKMLNEPRIIDLVNRIIRNKEIFHANLNIKYEEKESDNKYPIIIALFQCCLEVKNFGLIAYILKNYSQEEADINMPSYYFGVRGATGVFVLVKYAVSMTIRQDPMSFLVWDLLKIAMENFNIDFDREIFHDNSIDTLRRLIQQSNRADLISLMSKKELKEHVPRVNLFRKMASEKTHPSEKEKSPAVKTESKNNKPKQKKEMQPKAVEVDLNAIREQQIKEFETTIPKKIEKLNDEVEALQEKVKAAEEARKPVNEVFRRLYKEEEINQWKEALDKKLKTAEEKKPKSLEEYESLDIAIENYGAILSKLEHHFSQVKKNKKPSEKFHRGEKQQLTPQEKLKLEKEKRKEELAKEKKEKEERNKKRNEEKEKTRQAREEKEKQDKKNAELIEKARAEKEQERKARQLKEEKIKEAEEKIKAAEEKAKKEEETRVKTLLHMATPHIKSFIIGGIELQGLEALEKKSTVDFTELRMFQLSSFYHLLRYYVITRQIEGHSLDQIAMRNAIAHISMEFDLRLKTLHKAVDEMKSTLLSELKIVPGISKETIKSFVDLITGPSKIESSVTSIAQTELYQEFKRINDNITCDLKKSDLGKAGESKDSEEDAVYKNWVLTRMIPSINRFRAYYLPIRDKLKEFRKDHNENHQCREALNAIRMLLEWCGEFYNDERARRFRENPRIKPEEIIFLEATRQARISVGHFMREIPERQVEELAEMAKNLSKVTALFDDLHFSFSLRKKQAAKLSATAAAFSFSPAKKTPIPTPPVSTPAPATILYPSNKMR